MLEMLFNQVLYPTDPWNMVSSTRCSPFRVAKAFLIDVPISASYVLVPTSLVQLTSTLASYSLTVTLVYACQLASHLGVIHLLSG